MVEQLVIGCKIVLNQILFLTGFLSFLAFAFSWWKHLQIVKIIGIHKEYENLEKGVDNFITNINLSYSYPFICQLLQNKKRLQIQRNCPVESEDRLKTYRKSKVYSTLTYFFVGFSIALFLTLAIRCL